VLGRNGGWPPPRIDGPDRCGRPAPAATRLLLRLFPFPWHDRREQRWKMRRRGIPRAPQTKRVMEGGECRMDRVHGPWQENHGWGTRGCFCCRGHAHGHGHVMETGRRDASVSGLRDLIGPLFRPMTDPVSQRHSRNRPRTTSRGATRPNPILYPLQVAAPLFPPTTVVAARGVNRPPGRDVGVGADKVGHVCTHARRSRLA
jgi:hypothetical protein